MIIERQSEMPMPLLKNLAIFCDVQATSCRQVHRGRKLQKHSSYRKEVSTNLDNPRKGIRYSLSFVLGSKASSSNMQLGLRIS